MTTTEVKPLPPRQQEALGYILAFYESERRVIGSEKLSRLMNIRKQSAARLIDKIKLAGRMPGGTV